MKSSCKIYSFLRAVRGNWRNAIFVSCDCGNCMCGRTTPCSGFLLAVDECGQVKQADNKENNEGHGCVNADID